MPKIKNPAFDGMIPITPPAPKPEVLTKGKRKRMVQTGTDLRSLTTEDIAFILDMNNSDAAVRSRYHTAIQR